MDEIIQKVKNYIKKYNLINKNDTIILGVSGGADSICLLTILNELKEYYNLTLQVAHINHMIRDDAMEDADYVKKVCNNNNISYHLICKDVTTLAKKNHLSTEEMGRLVRYDSFVSLVDNENTKIAVAHNSNDTTETFLLNLFRGSGLNGLCSIKCKCQYKGAPIIRPILCLSRKEIENFLQKRNIEYKIDSTNLECEYTRNKIRNIILPYVEKNINSKSTNNISNAINSLNEVNDFINDYFYNKVKPNIQTFKYENGNVYSISLNILLKENIFIQKMIIKDMINNLIVGCKDISMKNLNDVLNICQKDGLKKINLNNNIIAIKEFGCLRIKNINTNEIFIQKVSENFKNFSKIINNFDKTIYFIEKSIFNKNANNNMQYIRKDINLNNLVVKNFNDNDYIILNNKKIKIRTYFNEHKIFYNTFYLANKNEVIWVFGQNQLNSNYYVENKQECFKVYF